MDNSLLPICGNVPITNSINVTFSRKLPLYCLTGLAAHPTDEGTLSIVHVALGETVEDLGALGVQVAGGDLLEAVEGCAEDGLGLHLEQGGEEEQEE